MHGSIPPCRFEQGGEEGTLACEGCVVLCPHTRHPLVVCRVSRIHLCLRLDPSGRTCVVLAFHSGYAVYRLPLPHEHVGEAQPLAMLCRPRAPVIPNHMFAPPHNKGREPGLDRSMNSAEGMISVGTVWSDEGFAGPVVALLDETADVSCHCEVMRRRRMGGYWSGVGL